MSMHDQSSQGPARAGAAPSLLRLSVTRRLAIAAGLAVLLWLAVLWALA